MSAAPLRGWRLNVVASCLAFVTYFCMYGFRKPFAAATYDAIGWFGLDAKTAFVTSQVLGYTLSKFLGIKWVSEVSRAARLRMLVGLVVLSELGLLGFALLPGPGKAAALFLNGLPLGMIWGLVVRYLEGRRSSELLLSGLSCSFIVASGAVKDVARWLLGKGVPEFWMPALTGLLFLPPLVLAAKLLDALPDPDSTDVAEREARPAMHARERRAFASRFLPGLALLVLVYLGLTAFRDYRDNYGVELFEELGYAREPALFSRTELPVAGLVLLLLGATSGVRDRIRGLLGVFAVMTAGLVAIGAATLALQAGWISGQLWMIGIGLGGYLAYVPFSSFLFDRIMAATRFAGTAVFAVNVADAVGYSGSVAMLLFKDLFARDTSRLRFFTSCSYVLSLVGSVGLLLAAAYFWRQARHARPSAA
ncbi:MAG TPA: DUF5690 family protein [Polyangiaceae bacterium]|nr:DUF5690 family protein [Polyangiaceae bacterium]